MENDSYSASEEEKELAHRRRYEAGRALAKLVQVQTIGELHAIRYGRIPKLDKVRHEVWRLEAEALRIDSQVAAGTKLYTYLDLEQ